MTIPPGWCVVCARPIPRPGSQGGRAQRACEDCARPWETLRHTAAVRRTMMLRVLAQAIRLAELLGEEHLAADLARARRRIERTRPVELAERQTARERIRQLAPALADHLEEG